MTPTQYLKAVLRDQTLTSDSDELRALREKRNEVEGILRDGLDASPNIKYGGSKAKGTMIKESYDLDILCYFEHEDNGAGSTLKEIYEAVRDVLGEEYLVESKNAALRIRSFDGTDFHVDVVPGRYVDDDNSDVFLYQAQGDKERLKTNPSIHITHVRDSGVRNAIKLMKLWKVRNHLQVKTFALELLVIKLLGDRKSDSLEDQLTYVWEQFRDNMDDLSIEDPANPSGNDLSELLSYAVRFSLSTMARSTRNLIDNSGWESIFGEVEEDEEEDKKASLYSIASTITRPSKPHYG